MKMRPSYVLVICVVLCVAAQAQTFTNIKIGTKNVYPAAINSSGEVVGNYQASGEIAQGFWRSPGGTVHGMLYPAVPAAVNSSGEIAGNWATKGFYQLPGKKIVRFWAVKEYDLTMVSDVNDAGWITGTRITDGGNNTSAGWLRSPAGVFTGFLDFGGGWVEVLGMNNSEQIVGYYRTSSSGPWLGFLYSNGTVSNLLYPGAVMTYPNQVNDSGEVVGTWWDSAEVGHGFYWTAAAGFTSFDVPGAASTGASSVNSAGVIVGCFSDAAGNQEGYALVNGQFTTIEYPKAAQTIVLKLNDAGTILGYWLNAKNASQGFLYQP